MLVRVVRVPIVNFGTRTFKFFLPKIFLDGIFFLDKFFNVVRDVRRHFLWIFREPFHVVVDVIPGDAGGNVIITL